MLLNVTKQIINHVREIKRTKKLLTFSCAACWWEWGELQPWVTAHLPCATFWWISLQQHLPYRLCFNWKLEYSNFLRAKATAVHCTLAQRKQISSKQMFAQLFKQVSVNIRCIVNEGRRQRSGPTAPDNLIRCHLRTETSVDSFPVSLNGARVFIMCQVASCPYSSEFKRQGHKLSTKREATFLKRRKQQLPVYHTPPISVLLIFRVSNFGVISQLSNQSRRSVGDDSQLRAWGVLCVNLGLPAPVPPSWQPSWKLSTHTPAPGMGWYDLWTGRIQSAPPTGSVP